MRAGDPRWWRRQRWSDKTKSWSTLASAFIRRVRAGLLPRRYKNTGQHQRKADDVEQLRTLAEEDDRHHRSEHRHDVKERRGAVGADQLDAAIETEIGDGGGEHRDVEHH